MSSQLRLPKGSTVLVTGATGLVGSATTEELVKQGYKVRAATRDASKTVPLADKLKKLYGDGLFEAVVVKDYTAKDAYKEAMQGADGVIHIASDVSFSTDTEKLVNDVKTATVEVMRTAASVPSIKAFVLTSSRIAVYNPVYGEDKEWSTKDFADYFYDLAKSVPADDPKKAVLTYAASKVEGEKAAWDFYRTNKPSYSFNTVLPDLVLGPIANPLPGHYSTVSMLTAFFNGVDDSVLVFMNPPANLVDSRDTAIIHVAALLANDVNGERLWALAHPLNINEILKIWREAYPERADKLPKDLDFPPAPKQIIDTSRSTELLKRFAGRSWIDAKTTILDNVKGHEA